MSMPISVSLSAGPICSGFWDCLPLTILAWILTVLPFVLAILLLYLVIYYAFKLRWPKGKILVLLVVFAVATGQIGYPVVSDIRHKSKYQSNQAEKAQKLNFVLYEPTYVVPDFDLAENEISFNQTLIFLYFDRSTQQSKDTTARHFYAVEVQESTDSPMPTIYGGDLLAFKSINETTVSVSGTISKGEANKVIESLKEVDGSEIEFYSDWANAR